MQMAKSPQDVRLSKTVSWLLRHAAVKEGLHVSSEGFVDVDELLSHKSLRGYSVEDIKRIVKFNDKQRFTLRDEEGKLEIRANQGHSLRVVGDLELKAIESPEQVSCVVHGTYRRHWEKIKTDGLKCMGRNHIHFATGLPSDKGVVSGMRKDVDVLIYIDIEKALESGLKFYLSSNGVVLSPGDEKGIIEPRFFLKVCDKKGVVLEVN